MKSYILAQIARLRSGYEKELAKYEDKALAGLASGALTAADMLEIQAAAWQQQKPADPDPEPDDTPADPKPPKPDSAPEQLPPPPVKRGGWVKKKT